MKTKTFVCVLLLLLILMPTTALAMQTYDIPELEIKIGMPDGWMIFTRDVKADDPNLKVLGDEEKALEQFFIDKNVFLDAFKADMTEQIVVTMIENVATKMIFDTNNLSDEELEKIAELDSGVLVYTNHFTYRNAQASYCYNDFYKTDDHTQKYGRIYTTIKNGQGINVVLHMENDMISADQEIMLKEIIDSIQFSEAGLAQTENPVLASTQTEPDFDPAENDKPDFVSALSRERMINPIRREIRIETPPPPDVTSDPPSQNNRRNGSSAVFSILLLGSIAGGVIYIVRYLKEK